VFQEFALPQGRLTFRGRRIDPAAIRKTARLSAGLVVPRPRRGCC
jgi:poly(3-hydroxybutyrate) depolymerase